MQRTVDRSEARAEKTPIDVMFWHDERMCLNRNMGLIGPAATAPSLNPYFATEPISLGAGLFVAFSE